MGFNELNSVGHYIIHQLSDVNLNAYPREESQPQTKIIDHANYSLSY